MHMVDMLISPAVGGIMLAATAKTTSYSIKNIEYNFDEKKIPLMGAMGAFVFASQMINFSILGTGSSGHLGGGMLLAILLGPHAGFLTMASILLIQALFFGDGGLLAYGCNVFNLGFYTCFVAYPLIYKKIIKKGINYKSIFYASLISSLIGLQLGSFSVVIQTLLSGKTELSFGTFALMMQSIHFAIGIVEGLVTSAVVALVWRVNPEIIERTADREYLGSASMKKLIVGILAAAVMIGGVFSWFASSNPDGLEWSVSKTIGTNEFIDLGGIHEALAELQDKVALLPDYGFKAYEDVNDILSSEKAGTTTSGIVGGTMTLAMASLIGLLISKFKKQPSH